MCEVLWRGNGVGEKLKCLFQMTFMFHDCKLVGVKVMLVAQGAGFVACIEREAVFVLVCVAYEARQLQNFLGEFGLFEKITKVLGLKSGPCR